MQEINERNLQNVAGGEENMKWYASQAERVCALCLKEQPGKCAGSWDLLIRHIHYVDGSVKHYTRCPYFRG